MNYPLIAARLYGAPLLIHPEKAEIIAWALREKLTPGLEIPEPNGPEASRFLGTRRRETRDWSFVRASKGVALIPVVGSLVNRGAWLDSRSGMTSYEGLDAQFKDAASDNEIHSIVIDIDTPGGEAGGMFKLAATVREAARSKRVIAVVDDMAASAGYGIISGADEIVVSPTSVVGSIGVVRLHLDRSGELAQKGIRPTLIYAGAHKVDGYPFGPLTAEVAAEMQQQVMTLYDRFLETVEAGRGARTTAQRARETEARLFIGAEAVKAGLADRIGSLDQVLSELSTPNRPRGRTFAGASRMSNAKDDTAQAGGFSQAELDQAVAKASAESFTKGKAEGKAEGFTEAVARLDAMLALPEAEGRKDQAIAAFRAGLSVDAAKTMLAASPKVVAASGLEQRMAAAAAEPSVGGPAKPKQAAADASAGWSKAVANANKRFG